METLLEAIIAAALVAIALMLAGLLIIVRAGVNEVIAGLQGIHDRLAARD